MEVEVSSTRHAENEAVAVGLPRATLVGAHPVAAAYERDDLPAYAGSSTLNS